MLWLDSGDTLNKVYRRRRQRGSMAKSIDNPLFCWYNIIDKRDRYDGKISSHEIW